MMRGSCGMKPIDRFRADANGSVKSKRVIRTAQIVINSFWNSNNRNSFTAKLMGDRKRPIAAHRNQNIKPPLTKVLDRLIRMIFKLYFFPLNNRHFEWIRAIGSAENGPAERENPGYLGLRQLMASLFDQTRVSVLNTKNFPPVIRDGGFGDRANNRI